ncbi:MAG: hypothetical protein KBC11_02595 [Candidatus Pacebacteria bacterium]|nr:hypothetical protein [Candidatus Paceibacterota bacterium]
MKFTLKKDQNIIKHKKDGRVNPHHFWLIFLVVFLLILILIILGFTYFFIRSSRSLDEEVVPKLDANTGQIKKIEQSIQISEKAISDRVGEPKSKTEE